MTSAAPPARLHGARGAEATPHAGLEVEIVQQLWRNVPALSWTCDLDSGSVRVTGLQPMSGSSSGDPVDPEALAARLRPHINGNGRGPFQALETLQGAGQLRHFLVIGFPFISTNGASHPCLGGVAIDITRHKQRVDEHAQQALQDELTGLYNLRGFFLFAEHELKVARRRGTRSAIVYVDVDGLKEINDANGHEEGNVVLVETAGVLRRAFRECDVIARLGGDEFAVFASDVRGEPELLAERLSQELMISGGMSRAVLSVSSGVALCGGEANLGLAHVLAQADEAMYRKKHDKLAGDPAPEGGRRPPKT